MTSTTPPLDPRKLYTNIQTLFNASLIGDLDKKHQGVFKQWCQEHLHLQTKTLSICGPKVI